MASVLIPIAAGAAAVTGYMAESNPYSNNIQSDAYIVPYIGIYDVDAGFTNSGGQEQTVGFAGEYRFPAWDYGLRPVVGAMVSGKGDVYGYAGASIDVPLYEDKVWFIPSAAVGAFEEGGGRDLGGVLEFRTSAEIAYQMENDHRLGLNIWHLSNAGIYDQNPGVEAVTIHYHIPVSHFGW